VPPTSPVTFRGASGKVANFTGVGVTVPAETQAGDALALVVTTATPADVDTPAGWTKVTSVTSVEMTTTVFQRVAEGGDAGSSVQVNLSATAKFTAQVVAYGGTRATSPVSAVTVSDPADGAARTAPAATVDAAGSWAVWYWAAKPADTATWTAPDGITVRDIQLGTGPGNVSALIADAGARPVGTVPSVTATTNVATSKANAVTLVFAPAP
jgi:hypothetical protein